MNKNDLSFPPIIEIFKKSISTTFKVFFYPGRKNCLFYFLILLAFFGMLLFMPQLALLLIIPNYLINAYVLVKIFGVLENEPKVLENTLRYTVTKLFPLIRMHILAMLPLFVAYVISVTAFVFFSSAITGLFLLHPVSAIIIFIPLVAIAIVPMVMFIVWLTNAGIAILIERVKVKETFTHILSVSFICFFNYAWRLLVLYFIPVSIIVGLGYFLIGLHLFELLVFIIAMGILSLAYYHAITIQLYKGLRPVIVNRRKQFSSKNKASDVREQGEVITDFNLQNNPTLAQE